MAKKEKEYISYSPGNPSSNADFISKLLNDYFSASKYEIWIFGSICLITIFLIALNYSQENVYFPFFKESSSGAVHMTLESSQGAVLKHYDILGRNKITLNDAAKLLLIIFVIYILLKTIMLCFITPLLRFVFDGVISITNRINIPLEKIFKNLPRYYSEKKWLADPMPLEYTNSQGQQIYPQLRKRIPLQVKNFKYIKFKIRIIKSLGHWRAGIFITSFDQNIDYVFHIYKNKGDKRIYSKMTKRILTEGHKNDHTKELIVPDSNNFIFEVTSPEKGSYALLINGQEVDRYLVPKKDFTFVEIAGWADDYPYTIELENIRFKG